MEDRCHRKGDPQQFSTNDIDPAPSSWVEVGPLVVPSPTTAPSGPRATILALVAEQPGIALSELLAALGIGWGSLYHHIGKLQDAGAIEVRRKGRRSLVFPADGDSTRFGDEQGLLRGATVRRVAQAVLEHPGRNVLEISDALSITPRTVYYHVNRLLKAGLIRSGSRTRHQALSPEPHLARLLRS